MCVLYRLVHVFRDENYILFIQSSSNTGIIFYSGLLELHGHTKICFTAKAVAANIPSTRPAWPSFFIISFALNSLFLCDKASFPNFNNDSCRQTRNYSNITSNQQTYIICMTALVICSYTILISWIKFGLENTKSRSNNQHFITVECDEI